MAKLENEGEETPTKISGELEGSTFASSARSKVGTRRDFLIDLGRGSEPLYKGIKSELIREINEGKMSGGEALPTEKELSARYGVSVGTVRRALADLVAEKVLIRQQGRGTFLAPFDSSRNLNSFWRILRKDGFLEAPIVHTLEFSEIDADAHLAGHLKVKVGDPLFSIVNIMIMGGEPTLLDTIFIPQALFPGLTEKRFVERGSTIYDLYRDSFGISVVKTVDQLSAASADRETAKRLDLALGTPLLEIVRTAFTFDDWPVEIRRSLLNTENYEFIDITGGSSEN